MESGGESSNRYSPSKLLLKLQEEEASQNPRDESQYCGRLLSTVSCASRRGSFTGLHSSKAHMGSSGCSINGSSSRCSSSTGCSGAGRRNSRNEAFFTTPVTGVNGCAQSHECDGGGPDASYYMRLLQYKKRHLQAEINRLKTETETATRETQQLSALQQKKEELENAVRCLQKDVAIINLAVSQGRVKLSGKDITNKTQTLREANEEKRKQLDQLFLSNRMRAEHLQLLEAEQEAFFESLHNCTSLQPQTRAQYEQLRSRLRHHHETLNKLRAESATTCQQLSTAETRLRGDGPRQKLRLLRRQQIQQQQLERLDVKALPSLRLPLDEQRAGVLQASLDVRDEIRQLELKQQRAQQQTQKHQARIGELQEALMLSNDGVAAKTSEEQEKLRLLAVRDTEISTFIEQQTKSVGAELQRRAALCAEELCNAQQQKQDLGKTLQEIPKKDQLQEWEDKNMRRHHDIEENEKHAQRLKAQLRDAEVELSEIPQLEQVRERAIWDVERRTEKLKEELKSTYDNIESLHRAKAQEHGQIAAEKERLRHAIEEATAKIDAICQEMQQLQRQLQQYPELVPLGQRLKRLVEREAAASQLRTRLEVEKKKHDYEAVKARCVQLTNEINASIRCALADQATISGGNVACTVQTRS